MDNKNLLPKDKSDLDFITNLKVKSIYEIRDIVPQLLDWMADLNWQITGLLFDYFGPFINDIDNEIVEILRGNDVCHKYSILIGLILHPRIKIVPNKKILLAVHNLLDNPSKMDIDEGNIEIAAEILEKYNFSEGNTINS